MRATAPLTLRHKAGYGTAEAGVVAVELMIQLYLLKFYTSVVGLPAELAGTALALAVIWDAVTDPLMGQISDGSRANAGRRRFYIIVGALALAIVFPLLFSPPTLEGNWAKFFYLLLTYMLVNTALTILSVPHTALGGELSSDPNQRTELFGFRLLFANFGFLVGTIVPGLVLAFVAKDRPDAGYVSRSYASFAAAGTVLLAGLITYMATAGRDKPYNGPRKSVAAGMLDFTRGIRLVLSNRAFVVLIIAFFAATVGRTLNSSFALYYYQYTLKLSEQDVIIKILGVFILIISLSILFWVLISRRYGKKGPALIGVAGLGVMTIIAYPLFPAGGLAGPIFAAVLGGFLVGSVVLYDALVADIVDWDRLRRGDDDSREGLYFGFWRMSSKIGRALGLALAGFALGWIGFQEDQTVQPPGVDRNLAYLFGPGVGTFFLLGTLIFFFMPWSTDIHERIRSLLARKKNKTERRENSKSIEMEAVK